MREVLEEAGVIGKLGRSLGVFEVCFFSFFDIKARQGFIEF